MENDEQEEGLEKQGTEEQFKAAGAMIFGFEGELLNLLPKEEITKIVADMAKTGVKGNCIIKKKELEKRIADNKYIFTVSTTGMAGNRSNKCGVVVEYKTDMMVGKKGEHGISIYEWRQYKKTAVENKSPEIKLALSRQFLSEKELEMAYKCVEMKQDLMLVAARGLLRQNHMDDVLRRSFKRCLENELGIKVYVWIVTIRHNDDRGTRRD